MSSRLCLIADTGFYQRGDPDNPRSIETSFLSLEVFQAQCNAAFPVGLPPSPAVDHVNKYGGWNMSPSNVLFTNGECEYQPRFISNTYENWHSVDPWRTMGLASIEENSPHRVPSPAVPMYVL